MPGLSFYCDFSGISEPKRTMILGHGSECIEDGSFNKLLIDDRYSVLTCTGYEGYPFTSFETEEVRIFLEGRLYGTEEHTVNEVLKTLAENLVRGLDAAVCERIRSWLLNTDGEFVLLVQHKQTGVVYIVTDALGRLPLYYSRNEQSIMVSRHMDLVAAVQDCMVEDRLGIAQYLLFAYSLGNRTLFQGVRCTEPSSIIMIDPQSALTDLQRLYTFSFSEKVHFDKSVETNGAELAHLLSLACQRRMKPNQRNVLSLSGGLDSRTIAACMKKAGVSFFAATMIDADGVFREDAEIAQEIARVLGIDWRLFKLQTPKGKDAYRLLDIKTGLNFLSMSFILQFFDRLRSTYGREMTYITGDGGDKILVDLRPKSSLRSLQDLVQYIVMRHQIFSLADVSRLTGIPEGSIVQSISEHVGSYPEYEFDNKLVHFVVFERGRRWLFEGEDRNRSFFWHLAPFYDMQLFRYAMNCPDEQKTNHKLYKEVLVRLSPEVAGIKNAHWGFPITSQKYYRFVWKRFALDLIPTEFKKRIKQLSANGIPRERYKECVSKQVSNCDVIGKCLMYSELMRQLDFCSKREAQTLLTVTSTLEMVVSGQSTIRNYWDEQF